eukprot:CAMPEP_0204825300 /NCGR_PEP_ID=MMETSP1346-20131115/3218_1 /ASSEMBLY_ACC=CAM_ASM_000771 /TAXON_ID=215587 /ORGANISM="Aplanochytrium stocchinoi, Strain GSBS06" /LENGTH=78 /DNA_ID=CAMNT_0051952887 /DNA_START=50 /DNA_END=286 /DNA_ORIENTATION=-
MKPLICGNTLYGDGADDSCDIEAISNPDNLALAPEHDILFIPEDTPYHVNNALWAFDLTNNELTRIMTTPYESEVTGR